MIAHFYLLAESFAKNDELPNYLVEEKVKRLSEDVVLMFKYKDTNKLYTNYEDLYPQIFYETYTVQDFICNPQDLKEKGVDRDTINSMQKILDKSNETHIKSDEVVRELLDWNDNENCHGIIAFHKIQELDENFQVIYGINGWYKFRRYFLSIYPKTPDFFIDECSKYFPNLYFHERNKNTVGEIIYNCSKKIIYHLTALNDNFRQSQKNGGNRTQILEHFSITNLLDQTASLEGNPARKPDLTFKFINYNGELEDVCCEPHLKLCYNDFYPGDMSYSNDRRIYFYEGRTNIQEGKILIGHIGEHL